jgi:MraZ protein
MTKASVQWWMLVGFCGVKGGDVAPFWPKIGFLWVRTIEPMFIGEYTHTVDNKGRITVPAVYRNELEDGAYLTRGLDGCLGLYPDAEWKHLTEKVKALPMTSRSARDFRRFFYGSAVETTPDRQGRILIPSYLREYASIGIEATVVGMDTFIEIWHPETWEVTRQSVEADEANVDRWADLGI